MKDGNAMNERTNPKQRGFFNEKAGIWDEITLHNQQKVRYIIERLEIRGDERVLDIGTGTGIMIPFYEGQLSDGSVVAVDFSERMIDMARAKYPEGKHPQISYLVSDLYDLKFDADFDLVVCYSCFPHFVDQPLAIEILSKALRKGGRLAVAHSDSAKKINGVHMNGGVEISDDFLPSMERLKGMMTDHGLTIHFDRDDDDYFICIAVKDRS